MFGRGNLIFLTFICVLIISAGFFGIWIGSFCVGNELDYVLEGIFSSLVGFIGLGGVSVFNQLEFYCF